MDGPPAFALEIFMLGPWQMKVAGEVVPNKAWKSKKALTLFRYLLAHRDQKVHKDALFELFWPDEEPEDASGPLHTTIYFLRRMLEPERKGSGTSSYIKYSDGMYWFEPDERCWIEVDEFTRYYGEGVELEEADPKGALRRFKKALALYRGDFLLEEAYEDWAEPARTQLREVYINLSLRAANILAVHERNVGEAVRVCRAALAKDPFREELHQAIMTHLIQAGRYGEAAAQYRQLTGLLQNEFGLPPSPETKALFDQMQSAAAGVPGRAASVSLDEGKKEGPFTCSREVFDAIRSVASRLYTRHGSPFCWLKLELAQWRLSRDQVEQMFQLLQGMLRQSDVLCLDAERIHILLLETETTGCEIVQRRIRRVLAHAGLPPVEVTAQVVANEGLKPKTGDSR